MGNEASQEAEEHAPIENKLEATWSHVALDTDSIPPREGHNVVAHNNKLYIFGGGGGDTQFNDLITINLGDYAKAKITPSGTTPSGRTGAAAQIVNGKIWIIGGLSTSSRGWVNDIYCLDVEKNEWTFVIPEGDRPLSPRDKLSSCTIGNKIYIIGGFGPRVKKTTEEGGGNEEKDDEGEDDEGEDDEDDEMEEGDEGERKGAKVPEFDWFDDVLVFDTESRTWATLTTTGTKPSPRCAAGVCALDDKHIFLFGGRDAHQRKNDSYVLNLETNEWTTMNPRGRAPDARSFHTATRIAEGVLVFGGMSVNNSHFSDVHVITHFGVADKPLSWLQPSSSTGSAPTARGFHTATRVGESVYVFGGSSGYDPELMCVTRFSNDLYKLDLAEKQEKQDTQQ